MAELAPGYNAGRVPRGLFDPAFQPERKGRNRALKGDSRDPAQGKCGRALRLELAESPGRMGQQNAQQCQVHGP